MYTKKRYFLKENVFIATEEEQKNMKERKKFISLNKKYIYGL